MKNKTNVTSTLSIVKKAVVLGLASAILCSCVGYVSGGNGFVPGHWNRFGQWVPGHYVGGRVVAGPVGPNGGVWVPAHAGRYGQWIPGHWR